MNCDDGGDRQVKSTERVRDLGEVFTPAPTVEAMLDLLPEGIWEPHPSPTFLEPACGDGNFLIAILRRKLDRISQRRSDGTLAAGSDADAVGFHALEALASIYAVDISADNVVGGTPGHEIGARSRMLTGFTGWYQQETGKKLTARNVITASAQWIVDHNLQVGNMLPFDAYGRPSGREGIALVEYTWQPETASVSVATTTLGAVMSASAANTATVLSLFDLPDEPTLVWSGPANELRSAPIADPVVPTGPVRNGNSRR